MTDLDAAPANVLKFIRYKCKLTGKNSCGTKLCSCQKSGLRCLMACGECRGQSCNNTGIAAEFDGDAEGEDLDI